MHTKPLWYFVILEDLNLQHFCPAWMLNRNKFGPKLRTVNPSHLYHRKCLKGEIEGHAFWPLFSPHPWVLANCCLVPATSKMSLGSIQNWFWFGWCWFSSSSLEMHWSKYLMHSGHLWLNIWLSDEHLCTNHARFHKEIPSKHLDLHCKGFARLELIL